MVEGFISDVRVSGSKPCFKVSTTRTSLSQPVNQSVYGREGISLFDFIFFLAMKRVMLFLK